MQGRAPYWIDPQDESFRFPPAQLALREPDGLLAIGGDLSTPRLLAAYRQGIFPWYNEDQPILWWTPDPRMVLFPQQLKISRSLRKTLRKGRFTLTLDSAFSEVISACSETRADGEGTWINPDMQQAYARLHRQGHAHSVECWHGDELVGGLYGVAIGRVFFGESMFSRMTDASKVALVYLVQQLRLWGFGLIDCQVYTAHLQSLGAQSIPRDRFLQLLDEFCPQPHAPGKWRFEQADAIGEALK